MTGPNWATATMPEPQRIVGQLEDEPGLGDLLHPRPDERDELADEEQPVVAVAEGADAVEADRHRRAFVGVRRGLEARVDLRAMGLEVGAPSLGLARPSPRAARSSGAGVADLAVDPVERVVDERPPLDRVRRRAEPLAVAGPCDLVLEELADLGQAEPGVVAEALDEPQSLEIVGVVEPVRALGAGRRLEQPELLVVADRSRASGRRRRRLPGFGGGARRSRSAHRSGSPPDATTSLPLTLRLGLDARRRGLTPRPVGAIYRLTIYRYS